MDMRVFSWGKLFLGLGSQSGTQQTIRNKPMQINENLSKTRQINFKLFFKNG